MVKNVSVYVYPSPLSPRPDPHSQCGTHGVSTVRSTRTEPEKRKERNSTVRNCNNSMWSERSVSVREGEGACVCEKEREREGVRE